MKNVHLLYLIFLISCNPKKPPPIEEQTLPDKVQLTIANESAYPITEVSVSTVNFQGLPKEQLEKRSFGHAIMPKKSDILFFNEFNIQEFSIRAFFLVNNDTIEKMRKKSDTSGEYTLTKGALTFELYYSTAKELVYTPVIGSYDTY